MRTWDALRSPEQSNGLSAEMPYSRVAKIGSHLAIILVVILGIRLLVVDQRATGMRSPYIPWYIRNPVGVLANERSAANLSCL
jgi:hypothetical protein